MWADSIPCKSEPKTAERMRAHLAGDHEMPSSVLDDTLPSAWFIWHAAEHRTRHPSSRGDEMMHAGHLRHIHEAYLPTGKR